uniref:NECAP PHear domain-containing protein n=1 Tax=Opuntia streptacantha TaxID=393608 RepID=A0A7C9A5B8_OPUST
MKAEKNPSNAKERVDDTEDAEALEIVLFQVSECYVYMIPPRKTASSYRADEWDVNKWAWEGAMKVINKGEECIIRLEDRSTGELYAQAFLRKGEPHPVEAVIDSSRYFVLRIEENIGGRLRHAFIGIGFRERPQAYDFQAALHDHMKYLDKKKTAEEMEQQFQNSSTVDYSLKDGETLVLQLKNKSCGTVKPKSIEQGVNDLSLSDKNKPKETLLSIKPPPPPPATLSPTAGSPRTPTSPNLSSKINVKAVQKDSRNQQPEEIENQSSEDVLDDDFGDFQAAG